jgi:hypothetical protein
MGMDSRSYTRDLVELNEGFLALVAQGQDAALPGPVLSRLRALDGAARRRLSAVSFALFGFGFDDSAAWARLLAPGVRDLDAGYAQCEVAVERFSLAALMALRGLARTMPESVSAWIGLPVQVRTGLVNLEFGLLPDVAVLAAPRLRGRLPAQELLWSGMIDAALRNDERRLALLAGYGKQWTIRRSLGIHAAAGKPRRHR